MQFMNIDPLQATLSDLKSELDAITGEVRRDLAPLSPVQINWKPSPKDWSIGQCIEHLTTANGLYLPTFDQILLGTKQATFWERLPLLPTFFGKFLVKSLDPTNEKHVEAPKVFLPTSSQVSDDIIEIFLEQQARIQAFMTAAVRLDLHQIKVTSPASSVVTYSLFDALRIIVVHERRHLLQTERLVDYPDFPS